MAANDTLRVYATQIASTLGTLLGLDVHDPIGRFTQEAFGLRVPQFRAAFLDMFRWTVASPITRRRLRRVARRRPFEPLDFRAQGLHFPNQEVHEGEQLFPRQMIQFIRRGQPSYAGYNTQLSKKS